MSQCEGFAQLSIIELNIVLRLKTGSHQWSSLNIRGRRTCNIWKFPSAFAVFSLIGYPVAFLL